MSTHEDAMQARSGMDTETERPSAVEMDPNAPDLHTLDANEQAARMGVDQPPAAMGRPPSERVSEESAGDLSAMDQPGADEMPSAEEIAAREEAAKRGQSP